MVGQCSRELSIFRGIFAPSRIWSAGCLGLALFFVWGGALRGGGLIFVFRGFFAGVGGVSGFAMALGAGPSLYGTPDIVR